jgi:hypothetical protein
LDLLDCPAGVFGDERFGIPGGPFEVGECLRIAGIAEGDADIAKDTAPFCAEEGSAAEAIPEPGIIQ